MTSVDFEHRFKALAECAPDAIFIADFDSARFVDVNQRACELFGYTRDELCGMTGRQLHPDEDGAEVDAISRELVADGAASRTAVRFQRRDGERFFGELRSGVYHSRGHKLYVTLVRDVSVHVLREAELEQACRALKQTEAQLVRSSRLAAIGEIAAGIAHEVNNPAASTLTNLELMRTDLQHLRAATQQSDKAVSSLVAAIDHFCRDTSDGIRDSIEGIQRIASIVKGLRGFTRIDAEDIERVDINEVVRTACNLVRHQIRHVAQLELELRATELLPASRGRLIQVVLNLLMNAAQAIEDASGGTIRVSTSSGNDHVVLRVEDDGPGIAPEIAEKVFDPFFTTKAADRGTGLGLSVCADIVHRHRGSFRLVEGARTRGACFEAEIPLDTGLITQTRLDTPLVPSCPPVRILVIDDEAALVRAYRRLLGRRHAVVVAYGGAEALDILASDQDFDLILCDLMMPGTDGKDVYDSLQRSHPALVERIVFVSGGPTSSRTRDFVRQPGLVMLDKPLTTEALNQFIARRFSGTPSHFAKRESAPGSAAAASSAMGSTEGTEWK